MNSVSCPGQGCVVFSLAFQIQSELDCHCGMHATSLPAALLLVHPKPELGVTVSNLSETLF